MATSAAAAERALNREMLERYPAEAVRRLEVLAEDDAVAALADQPIAATAAVWEQLPSEAAGRLVVRLAPEAAREILARIDPRRAAQMLATLEDDERDRLMAGLDDRTTATLGTLLSYPPGSAGALMDPRVILFRPEMTAAGALDRLRASGRHGIRVGFVVDDDERLVGQFEVQDLALARPEALLSEIRSGLVAAVGELAGAHEVFETLDRHRLTDLPVVDFDGRLVGVVRHSALIDATQSEMSAALQTMVGASREERALSPVGFAVRKRLPWLQINLLTAFLAAAVVGLFESTIAKYTALAILLPVVAGQSGNTGAQALAVTMRGLALREIGTAMWARVVTKEVWVGLVNGIAVALTTAVGVLVWSGSPGLAAVILLSMIISMVIAGLAGAAVPMVLTVLGQDPAQSSSIVLTTVTDVTGFFSFLGIATLLSGMLG